MTVMIQCSLVKWSITWLHRQTYNKNNCVPFRVAIAGLEILHNNQWLCMKRGSNNHFLINNLGEIKFPIKVRLTSISNEQLESAIDKLENDVDVSSTIQFSGFSTGMWFTSLWNERWRLCQFEKCTTVSHLSWAFTFHL